MSAANLNSAPHHQLSGLHQTPTGVSTGNHSMMGMMAGGAGGNNTMSLNPTLTDMQMSRLAAVAEEWVFTLFSKRKKYKYNHLPNQILPLSATARAQTAQLEKTLLQRTRARARHERMRPAAHGRDPEIRRDLRPLRLQTTSRKATLGARTVRERGGHPDLQVHSGAVVPARWAVPSCAEDCAQIGFRSVGRCAPVWNEVSKKKVARVSN